MTPNRFTPVIYWCAWAGMLLAVGALSGCNGEPKGLGTRAEGYLGLYAGRVLENPTRIEGWTYAAPDGRRLSDPQAHALDLSVAKQLRDILYEDATYQGTPPPAPGQWSAGFRITRDRDVVELLVSFSNDAMLLKTRGNTNQPTSSVGSFAGSRDRMLEVVRNAFPDFKP